ncbi:MAG: hypothetical protein M3Z37_11300 [Candidatus Eremiobacteraeota bacterium]|nr:hypothetical protein [Candidatus Eremiobacteraeota bacterium]
MNDHARRALLLGCALLLWLGHPAGAAPSPGVPRNTQSGTPFRVAAVPVLQYVQSQQLPNGHIRILLQFSGNAPMRQTTSGPTTNFNLQFVGAVMAATVPNGIPVNLGPIQMVSVTQLGNALNVAVSMSSAVQPRVSASSANGLVVIDVPPAPGAIGLQQPNPYGAPSESPSPSAGTTMTKVVRLHYADISEVVGILTGNGTVTPGNVFNPQPSQIGTAPTGGFNQGISTGQFNQGVQPFPQYQQPGAGVGDQQALGQRISDTVAIDRRLNSIILSGTREQIAQAEAIIRMIDVPVESVLLDTQIIEVTVSGSKALGVDFQQSETSPLSRVFNTQSQIINNLPTGAIAGSVAVQANIFLLVSQGNARVLAAPKILTQDGVSASILTGDSLPIRVTTPVGVGGVGAVSSQVEYINVGVNLQILPRVTGNGGVDANIYSQVSSVTGFTTQNDPQISTRQAQTRVNVLAGQTLVIGGLLQQRDIRNVQKIPILGDLPLVGSLFRFYTQTRQDTNLVIAITPHVVPAPGAAAPPSPTPAPAPAPTR